LYFLSLEIAMVPPLHAAGCSAHFSLTRQAIRQLDTPSLKREQNATLRSLGSATQLFGLRAQPADDRIIYARFERRAGQF